ncbi:caspase, EACC1-associated type [Streptomyces sp. MS06]|uniref:caspase, EACC1-associated type n=1 Tax=Streptomyces sp. MS06 TaxID=3385974 RepID=UPI0039A1E2BD
MTALSDPDRSRAVLIGVHTYRKLGDLPAVRHNLEGLHRVLTDSGVWGLPADRCTTLDQPAGAEDVLDAVAHAATEASDTLLVYYAGHGLTDPHAEELYLALPDTDADREYTALRYEYLRRAVLAPSATARRTVVVLDCCYSGRALVGSMSAGEHLAEHAVVEGTCLLTAAAETRTALAPPDETYTAFTGELLTALNEGIPDGPDPIDMDTLFRHLHRSLAARSRPLPQQRNRNAGGRIALARNRAAAAASPSALRSAPPETSPGILPRRHMLLGAIGTGTTLLGGTAWLINARNGSGSAGDPAGRTGSPSAHDPTERTAAKERWRFRTGDGVASPAVREGTVYVGSNDENLYAVHAASGEQRWRFSTDGSPTSDRPPALGDGVVYTGTLSGALYALDAANGKQRWRFDIGFDVFSSPVLAGGLVYVGNLNGVVYAVDADKGTERWRFTAASKITSSPTVSHALVLFGCDDRLHAVDAASGRARWHIATGGAVFTAPEVADGKAYFGGEDKKLRAVNVYTQKEEWTFTAKGEIEGAPTVADGMVYFGSADGNLYALDTRTGSRNWAFRTAGQLLGGPTVVDGTVYFGSDDHNLYALDAATGRKKWAFRTADGVRSTPLLADGTLYFGSRDGALYAIRL